jgi:hypothetical protein
MVRLPQHFRRTILLGLLLLGPTLACNLPVGQVATPSPPSGTTSGPATSAPTLTIGPAETLPFAVSSATPGAPDRSPRPTFTAINPTLAPTLAPSSTPRPRLTASPTPTAAGGTATADNGGPLSFDYNISWTLSAADPYVAVATVNIYPRGGGGDYEYYRDDLPVDGPTFQYRWVACRANPGSLRVDSADGQSARKDYFESPPCPTPTPTKSP